MNVDLDLDLIRLQCVPNLGTEQKHAVAVGDSHRRPHLALTYCLEETANWQPIVIMMVLSKAFCVFFLW